MFVFVGVGEKAGSGANIISAGWRDNGWQVPTLVEHQLPNRVETTLFIADLIEQQKDIVAEDSGMKSGMKTDNDAESGLKSGMKTDNDAESGMKSGMKTTQDRIIQLIKSNPQISIIAIAEELKMAKSGIAKQMQQLQALGIIKRIGPDKGGHWEIVSEGKSK